MTYTVNIISAQASFGKGGETSIGAHGTFTYKLSKNESVLASFRYESGRRQGRQRKPSHTLEITDSRVSNQMDLETRTALAETIKQTAKAAVRLRVIEFLRERERDLA